MAIGKEIQLYGDIGKSQPVYPKTNVKCVYYDDGTRLDRMIADVGNPRNLLDNSDFTNPVNQRGQTSYSGQGYGIDRWKSWNSENVTTVNSGSVSCTKQLWQDIEPHKIKPNTPYTFAACQTDGTILCLCALSGEETKLFDGTKTRLVIAFEDDSPAVWLAAGDYVWVALYEGEYTAETLPEYQPKGYGAELAECLRYFYRNPEPIRFSRGPGNSLVTNVFYPTKMRVIPSLRAGTEGVAYDQMSDVGFSCFYPGSDEAIEWLEASADL